MTAMPTTSIIRDRAVSAISTFVLLTVVCTAASAGVVHVYEGESIQAAISAATSGDEIVVHPGTYNEAIDFLGKAINLHSTGGPEVTTIDATGLDSRVVTCADEEGPDTILEGFSITAGNAGSANGGGMFISMAGPTLRNCTFRENEADYGGGVFNSAGTPVLIDCTFEDNSASFSGGGMYNFGSPGQPGATLTNCQFNENTAQSSGGGMRNWDSSPTLTACTFELNHARYAGAGMANGGVSHPALTGCMFRSNRTDTLFSNWDSYGGGMLNSEDASPTLVNCVFQSNSAHAMLPWLSRGGAMANLGNASPEIVNCTMITNHANLGDGLFNRDAAVAEIANSILWDSDDEIVNEGGGSVDVHHSDVKGAWPGPGNIDADPLLQDLSPMPGSPCIDAGDNAAVPDGVTTDFCGEPRFVDDPETVDTGIGDPPIVDLGATEFQLEAPPCPGDVNGDGEVGFQDLVVVLGNWSLDPTQYPGDANEDGQIDFGDLLLVLSEWGPCG